MTRRATFTQSDVTRLLKGAKEDGYRCVRVEVDSEGTLALVAEIDDQAESDPLDRLHGSP